MQTVKDWSARRSGATMTITGLDEACAATTVTGVEQIEAREDGVFAMLSDESELRLGTPK